MSFSYGIKETIEASRLASNVVSSCRRACGEYDGLTRDVAGLHVVLRRLENESTNPESLLSRQDDTRKENLKTHAEGCSKVLSILNNILEKYNALSEKGEGGATMEQDQIWKRGNARSE
jgi:hypothetical protein